MSLKVTVDEWACAGHGLCEIEAPTVFTVNDDGIAVVTDEHPDEALRGAVVEAARVCPAAAVLLSETA